MTQEYVTATVIPPQVDAPLTLLRTKWSLVSATRNEDGTDTVHGSLTFSDLRTALLKIWRDRCPWRVCDVTGFVVYEGDLLTPEIAKIVIEEQAMLLEENP